MYTCVLGRRSAGTRRKRRKTVTGWGAEVWEHGLLRGSQEQLQPREESECFPVSLLSVRLRAAEVKRERNEGGPENKLAVASLDEK